MSRLARFLSWQAALGMFLAGCAPQTDYSAVSTSPVNMVCDGGRTFTLAYANNFETAIIETEGRRVELTKVRTTLGSTPTPTLPSSVAAADTAPSVAFAPTTGTTGVRYGDGDNLLLSRGRQAALELDGEVYSNCETPK